MEPGIPLRGSPEVGEGRTCKLLGHLRKEPAELSSPHLEEGQGSRRPALGGLGAERATAPQPPPGLAQVGWFGREII